MAAICHHVITKVARGENVAVTSREQVWHQPSLKHQHELTFSGTSTSKKLKVVLSIYANKCFFLLLRNLAKHC